MIATWYNTSQRISALEADALSWRGTPFGQNGNAKGPGGGVSCQKLAAALHVNSGCIASFDPPAAPMGWARHQRESIIAPYMAAHPRFVRLDEGERPIPGDVLGFKIQACIHHMGTALQRGLFVHVWQNTGVIFSMISDPTYGKRLAAIWRPIP